MSISWLVLSLILAGLAFAADPGESPASSGSDPNAPVTQGEPFPGLASRISKEAFAVDEKAAVQLQKDLVSAILRGDKSFTIPPGDYRFSPDAQPNLVLNKVSDLIIHADGVTFWLYPFQRLDGILLEHSSNVTIRGLTVDYYPTAYPQGVITGFDAKQGWFDLRLDEGYSTPFDVPGHLTNAKIIHYAPSGEFLASRMDWVASTESQGERIYRVHPREAVIFRNLPSPFLGTRVALAGRTMRMAFSLHECTRCTLEDITVYATPHMAFVELLGDGGNSYRGCKVILRPGSNRLLASNADVLHSAAVRKGPLIEKCELSNAGDDLINIHGLLSMVYAQTAPDTVTILTQLGTDLPAGTALTFHGGVALEGKGEARVVERSTVTDPAVLDGAKAMIEEKKLAVLRPPGVVQVKLDRPVQVAKYDFVDDDARSGRGATVRDCFFHDGYARAVLLKSPDTLVEDNLCRNMGISSIAVSIDPHFMEGPFPANITIRGNTIEHNGYSDLISDGYWNYLIGAISVTTETIKGLAPDPMISNIEITNNTITDSVNCGIFTSNVARGQIRDNAISGAMSRQPQNMGQRMQVPDPDYGILIANSRDIILEGNKITSPGHYSSGPIGFAGTVKNVGPQGPANP